MSPRARSALNWLSGIARTCRQADDQILRCSIVFLPIILTVSQAEVDLSIGEATVSHLTGLQLAQSPQRTSLGRAIAIYLKMERASHAIGRGFESLILQLLFFFLFFLRADDMNMRPALESASGATWIFQRRRGEAAATSKIPHNLHCSFFAFFSFYFEMKCARGFLMILGGLVSQGARIFLATRADPRCA